MAVDDLSWASPSPRAWRRSSSRSSTAGLPVEYELTRSIRVVSRSGRKKVGILTTDAKMMGGFDMRSFSQNPEWSIVTELKKQYDVSSVSPDASIPGDVDVLLVAQPSSLTQKQIDNLTDYVKKGGADAAVPRPAARATTRRSRPRCPRCRRAARSAAARRPSPRATCARCSTCSASTGPRPRSSGTRYNPHPQLAEPAARDRLHRHGQRRRDAFNHEQTASSGLQEIVTIFPGLLRAQDGRVRPEFIPAAPDRRRGRHAALERGRPAELHGRPGINPRRRYFPSGEATRWPPASPARPGRAEPAEAAKKDADEEGRGDQKARSRPKINVIAIADLDLIGEQFFELRRQKIENLDFDNVPFVLNCVDVLAGDESFVSLRKKRPKHRTLSTLEAQTKQVLRGARRTRPRTPRTRPRSELEEAQKAFDKQVEASRATPISTSGPRRSSSPTSRASPSAGSTWRRPIIEDQKLARDPREQGRASSRASARSRTRCGSRPPRCRRCRR